MLRAQDQFKYTILRIRRNRVETALSLTFQGFPLMALVMLVSCELHLGSLYVQDLVPRVLMNCEHAGILVKEKKTLFIDFRAVSGRILQVRESYL
jgi:hypothetical protein